MTGILGALLVSRYVARRSVPVSGLVAALSLPVYSAVVVVALFPGVSDWFDLKPLQVEGSS